MNRTFRATKIVATLGPASDAPGIVTRLAAAGADVFRLNFSHGRHEEHQQRLAMVRIAERELGRPLAVMADLQGPKFRLGDIVDGTLALTVGQRLRLDLGPAPGTAERLPLPHAEVFRALQPGDPLLIDDGKMRFEVLECSHQHAVVVAMTSGYVSKCKGVNAPRTPLPVAAVTHKDREDLAFALALGVDWVALSFVQSAEDVLAVKALVQGRAGVLAKIEKPLALDRLDAIVDAADALMVARGDLGVELNPEDVPLAQRRIVHACRRVGKPVVVATQMLESMIAAPAPTRAEASDVAGAVYDAVDAVMLSAESAAGRYPVEAVAMMARIVCRVEADPAHRETLRAIRTEVAPRSADAIGAAVRSVADTVPLAGIVTYTTSGRAALHVAHERPAAPLIGLTPDPATARRLALVWGVLPALCDDADDVEQMVELATREARRLGLALDQRPLAIVAGLPFGQPGSTNMLRLVAPLAATVAPPPARSTLHAHLVGMSQGTPD